MALEPARIGRLMCATPCCAPQPVVATSTAPVIDVTNPPAGLTPWSTASTDNAAAIVETFEHARSLMVGPTIITINIPPGVYRHSGVSLDHISWPGNFARLIINGTQGGRRSTLLCTNNDGPNLSLSTAWGFVINHVAFYQGLYGLRLFNSQYARLNGCTFEQQKPVTGAGLRVESGQHLQVNDCNFLQSHSAFLSAVKSTTVLMRNCLIGEAIQGATVSGATVWIQDCAMFGLGSNHTTDGSAFRVEVGGSLFIDSTSIRLTSAVSKLFSTNSPGTIALRNSHVAYDSPLTVAACGTLATYSYPPLMVQGSTFAGSHALTLATFKDASRVPRNSVISGNVFSFTRGGTGGLTPYVEMQAPEQNNVIQGNVERMSSGSI